METAAKTSRSSGVTAEAVQAMRRYGAASEAFGSLAAVINAAHGELVDLTVLTLAEGHHVGPGLHSPAQYVAWQTGVAKATANRLVRVARRADDLPHLVGALRAGEISLDQADVVAQHCPARYDRSATELARSATVDQLRTVMAAYRDRPASEGRGDGAEPPEPAVSIARDEHGATVRARISNDQADLFQAALDAMREDLYRQRRRDARSAAHETGTELGPVAAPTGIDALVAMAESALRSGEAAHPGAERYLISYHLHVGADGHRCLTDDRGRPVQEGERRRILCDCAGEAVFHDQHGNPLSVGRKTRVVGRKLRRAILFRHRNRCAVPGCDTSYGLEIHHIWHWEDGGPTSTANLIPLCRHHHKVHHLGLLKVDGDADLPLGSPGGVTFTSVERVAVTELPRRRSVGPVVARTVHRLQRELERRSLHRHRPGRSAGTGTRRSGPTASTPTGERLRRWGVHLEAEPQPPLRT